MSRAPIRDALNKLEREGLVTLIPRKGAFVESINPVDVANRYDIREVVEGLAARLLARKITPGNAAVLEELATKADDPSAAIHDELAFHSAVIEMSGNPELLRVVQSFCLHTMIYDERTGKLAVDGDASMSVQYRISDAHRSVASAIISGDPREAERSMRWHIRSGKSVVTKYLLGIDDFDEY
jgi:DNA-binding GntR family transcriptional regulator